MPCRFVPRSSEAFATSWLIGIGAALFSLGLPVRSISCIRRKQVIELGTMDKDPLDTIGELGSRGDEQLESSPSNEASSHTLESLQQWTCPDTPEKYMREFSRIRRAVDAYAKRWHWWHVPAMFIAAAQVCIFYWLIEPLLRSAGIPMFIFACPNSSLGWDWTGLYLAVSALVSAVARFAMWQLCDHEVVRSKYKLVRHLWVFTKQCANRERSLHLSDAAQKALDTMKSPSLPTTATQLPPLYPPLISAFYTYTGNIIKRFLLRSHKPLPPEHPHTPTLTLRASFTVAFSYIRHPFTALRSGFTDNAAAARYRPLVVLIHLSTQGRPQIRTLFTGFCEAALLLALTFFFASQWGGNLFITAIALSLILLFITLDRALAIMYVWLSARTWGLHAINCDEQEEILGCLRIVCSMRGVLVTVNGAHYFDGYRLDYERGFAQWRARYAAGMFDGDGKGRVEEVTVEPKGDGREMV